MLVCSDRWSKITKSCYLKKLALLPTILSKSILFLSYSRLDDKAFRLEIFSRLRELLAWYPTTQLLYFRNFQYAFTTQKLMPLLLLPTIIPLMRHYKPGILQVEYLPPLPISKKSLKLKSLYHFFSFSRSSPNFTRYFSGVWYRRSGIKKPVLTKEKSVSKRKKLPGWYRVGREWLKKKGRRKF